MPIEANVSGGSPITASVGETQIDVAAGSTAAQVAVNVSGGFGPSGSNGSAGAAATVAVGSVTTGAAGSSASVVNAGSSSAAVLNFTIPAGATGPQGPAGPAGGNYTLPTATASVLGGVKIGSGITIDGNGVISASSGYTLPSATTSTLGGVIVGAGLSVSSGTVSANLTSVAGRTGAVTLSKSDVALGNVDNTSDAAKPISTATQTALDGKAATSHAHGAGDITSGTLAAARLPIVLEQTQAIGNSGTSTTLALTTGSVQTVTLNGNCTFTMPAATAGASITLILTQSGTFTAAFTGVLWAGGTAPTITATASKVDVLVFISNGTSWFGTAAQNF